jgi:SAM-dependent methyltransferase
MSSAAHEPTELERIYSRRFEANATYRQKVWNVLIERVFSGHIRTDAAVLDLGCGYGEFINNVRARVKYGMDMNPRTKSLLAPQVTFLQQDCSQKWSLPDASLDVVFTSNFFEHLPNKRALSDTLDEIYRCLRPGGRLIAMGPNIRATGGAYWDFYDHHVALTELSMTEILEVKGFQISTVVARFLPYTMVKAPRYPVSLLVVYLKMPILWRFLGKQFLVIAVKET